MLERSSDFAVLRGDQLRLLLEHCYELGFMASGEGWNGEYPFLNQREKLIFEAEFIRTRDDAIEAIIKNEKLRISLEVQTKE